MTARLSASPYWQGKFINGLYAGFKGHGGATFYKPSEKGKQYYFSKLKKRIMEKTLQAESEPIVHVLKTVEPCFSQVKFGFKKFDVRKDDRNFQVGDILDLRKWDGEKFTKDNPVKARITFKLEGGQFGIEKGYCVLGIDINEVREKPVLKY